MDAKPAAAMAATAEQPSHQPPVADPVSEPPAAAAAVGVEAAAATETGGLFREVAGLEIGSLQVYLRGCVLPFEASQLYDSQKEEKVTDDTMRRSKFRLLKDSTLFDALSDGIIREINRTDPSKVFSLVRNDVSHIVYGPGDFFKRHSDYLSVTSNIIEE